MDVRRGMKVVVMGLGVAGLATVRYLLHRGARVAVSDLSRADQIDASILAFLHEAGVDVETGGHTAGFLTGADLIVPGPGVPFDLPILAQARTGGIQVLGELGLAAGQFNVPVIAVTGSNGKTTVTSLIGFLLQTAGKAPFVGGNIGTPLLDYFADPHPYRSVVLELSSFQLDLIGDFRPNIGLLLNLSPDHIDRHGSLERYAEAKIRLFSNQRPGDAAILGADDLVVDTAPVNQGVRILRFGVGDSCQARIREDRIYLDINGSESVFSLTDTRLRSSVNQLNAAAAILAASLAGCGQEAIEQGLRVFQPPPHRMAEVAFINGIRFVDDSKATNIGALQAALAGCSEPVVLIAGGRDKGSDFTLLREVVARRVKRMVLIGEAAGLMRQALSPVVACESAESMEDAVNKAIAAAESGDLVLLAPGCASFDMFSGYAERGRLFCESVHRLGQKDGRN